MTKKAATLMIGLAALTALGAPARSQTKSPQPEKPRSEVATFAGGCFWCMQPSFDKVPGVVSTLVGYTGGTTKNPTYEEVSSGLTGHRESVQITFDPAKVSYAKLVEVFWRNTDPTQEDGQFVDHGSQYRTAIFYHNEKQKKVAEASKQRLQKSGRYGGRPIVTDIIPASIFYPAEEYHQEFYKKSRLHYGLYHAGSGRDEFLNKIWGHDPPKETTMENKEAIPSDAQLRKKLTPEQYSVTREDGTEPPFHNAYWDNHEAGIYVDAISGEPLFSSTDKYDSGTGWPSFTKPIDKIDVVEKTDNSLFMSRTEVRSKTSNAHLGHVFDDGPAPTGQRFCINSAALRFVPVSKLEAEGYGKYLSLFKSKTGADKNAK